MNLLAEADVKVSASKRTLLVSAKNFPLDENGNPIKGIPRHPIVEDDVIIYSNATLLGRITIGKGAVIGANVWVTHDVEPKAKVLERKL
jgi:serine O-acetyltransferase